MHEPEPQPEPSRAARRREGRTKKKAERREGVRAITEPHANLQVEIQNALPKAFRQLGIFFNHTIDHSASSAGHLIEKLVQLGWDVVVAPAHQARMDIGLLTGMPREEAIYLVELYPPKQPLPFSIVGDNLMLSLASLVIAGAAALAGDTGDTEKQPSKARQR